MKPRPVRRGARPLTLWLCLALAVWTGGCCAAKRHCKFDGMVDNSALQFCFLDVCPAQLDAAGEIGVECKSKPLSAERDCTCALKHLDPISIVGVGTLCFEPHEPCAKGRLDCDGGSGLDVDTVAHAQLGTCTGNADCASQCVAHCGGLGKAVYDSGCEMFCQSGTRKDLPCVCDEAGSPSCAGGIAGANDCPAGSCEGKDNEIDADCHCTCVDTAAGAASAGTIGCAIGLRIRLEADPICDGAPVLVRFQEPPCAPFTSGTATGLVTESNEGFSPQGPFSDTGSSGTCSAFDQEVMTGYELVSVITFLDTTIGDIFFRFTADCQ